MLRWIVFENPPSYINMVFFNKKKRGDDSRPVSRVLFLDAEAKASVIYLSRTSPHGFIGLPSSIGRAALKHWST